MNRELLLSGADIGDMNAVRKHLSAVKGGRLAQAAAPARLVTLVISDVVDDDLSVIASGPTVPDPTTFEQALGIVRTYGITSPAATTTLEQGVAGGLSETPKPGAPLLPLPRPGWWQAASEASRRQRRSLSTPGSSRIF